MIKNFNTAVYIMRLNKEDSKYDGLLKIGISNDISRRIKEIGNVSCEWNDNYRAPRSLVMVTEMLAQAYAYRKVGRPTNYRQALPVRSGSSEFFNTDNVRQARGFISAAKRMVREFADDHGFQPEIFDAGETEIEKSNLHDTVTAIINYIKGIFRALNKRLPQSFRMEIVRINQVLAQEKGA